MTLDKINVFIFYEFISHLIEASFRPQLTNNQLTNEPAIL
jgi:hypothetical protein